MIGTSLLVVYEADKQQVGVWWIDFDKCQVPPPTPTTTTTTPTTDKDPNQEKYIALDNYQQRSYLSSEMDQSYHQYGRSKLQLQTTSENKSKLKLTGNVRKLTRTNNTLSGGVDVGLDNFIKVGVIIGHYVIRMCSAIYII